MESIADRYRIERAAWRHRGRAALPSAPPRPTRTLGHRKGVPRAYLDKPKAVVATIIALPVHSMAMTLVTRARS